MIVAQNPRTLQELVQHWWSNSRCRYENKKHTR